MCLEIVVIAKLYINGMLIIHFWIVISYRNFKWFGLYLKIKFLIIQFRFKKSYNGFYDFHFRVILPPG